MGYPTRVDSQRSGWLIRDVISTLESRNHELCKYPADPGLLLLEAQ